MNHIWFCVLCLGEEFNLVDRRRVKREREDRCLRLIGEGRREGGGFARAPPPRGHRFCNGRETMPNAAAVRLPPPIRLASVTGGEIEDGVVGEVLWQLYFNPSLN